MLLGADPGLGRMLGLFSLGALPRRLTGDFREFMVEGFKFDRIKGTVELVDGVAHTNNMTMRGSVGRIYVKGISDLNQRTYDQEVSVVPDLSASVPLVGELVVPGSGLEVLAVGTLLKQMGVDVERAGELKYTLRGPWDAPVMEGINTPKTRAGTVERNK